MAREKVSILQELVKPVPICQNESFPLPVAEGTYGYLWLDITAHGGLQASSVPSNKIYTLQSPC